MPKPNFYNYPVDVPAVEKPGLRYRESEAPGSAKHLAVGPEDPSRREKGDLPMTTIPGFDPQPLSHEGVPWKGLK